jgi:hypothetical protein
MGHSDRIEIIKEIEAQRNSKMICYLTSLRPGLNAQMGEDAIRAFFEHLQLLPTVPVEKLDIFICSNGGNGVVPWRLMSLLREYANHVAVLIPYRAYSAATMLALGANEILMHPFAEMGPIDPTVSNEFNPVDPVTHQRQGISVEDVKAYISFIKDTIGIRHEDELIKAVEILASNVHPLALGNVERFLAQSRMIARKLLEMHTDESNKHKLTDIIETLTSKLYFHGHPISRHEASVELGLNVSVDLPPALETAMWKLYSDFETELENLKIMDPMAEIYKSVPPAVNPLAPSLIPNGTSVTFDLKYAIVESARLSSSFDTTRRFVVAASGPNGEPMVRTEGLTGGWTHVPAPAQHPAP